jgi:ketol-acid reductoisomerase
VRRGSEVPVEGLTGKCVAIIGYGNQGRAHALNLRDSGIEVLVGTREGPGANNARDEGFDVRSIEEATSAGALVVIALPDETQASVFADAIAPNLEPGTTVGFIHGFAIHHGLIDPPEGTGVIMVAPKGPGTTLRTRFEAGQGIPCLLAVHRDSHAGDAEAIALAWAAGLGCARAGVIDTTFAHETETDLFGEQTVLCGGIAALILAAFETLVEAGYPPELAYIECCHEVKQIADLVYERGLTGMRQAISNTAEFGAYDAMQRLDTPELRAQFKEILEEIQSGRFGQRMQADHSTGGQAIARARDAGETHPIEEAGKLIRSLMPWLADEGHGKRRTTRDSTSTTR